MESRFYSKPECELIPVVIETEFTTSDSKTTESIDGSRDDQIEW